MTLILDTNVVIDWLVFDDPYMAALRQAIASRYATVLTSAPATAEFHRVLAYPQLKLDPARQSEIFAQYVGAATVAVLPQEFSLANLLLPPKFPRCRDEDDQHFLALAWHSRATLLATRDKALLKVKKKAARFGVTVVDVQGLIGRLAVNGEWSE